MDVVVEAVVVVVEVVDVVVDEVEVVDVVTTDVEAALTIVVEDVNIVKVEDEEVETAASVEDVVLVSLEEDVVNNVLNGAGADVAVEVVVMVDAVESGDKLDDVVTIESQPPAGAGILSSSCPECPCLVESSSTSISTNLLSPAEWQIEIFCTP